MLPDRHGLLTLANTLLQRCKPRPTKEVRVFPTDRFACCRAGAPVFGSRRGFFRQSVLPFLLY